TGLVPNKGRTDDATLELNGTAEANSTVEVFNGVTSLGTVKASKVGDWIFTTPALTDGTQRFTATSTDAAKNTSEVSNTFVVTTDTTPPAAPVLVSFEDDAGRIKGNVESNGATDDAQPLIKGQAEAASRVEIFDGSTSLGAVTAGKSGGWSFTPPTLKDGIHTVTAVATDAAGNTSTASAAFTFTVNTKIPNAPSITKARDDVGRVKGLLADGDKTDDTNISLTGTAASKTTVEILDGTLSLGTVTANNKGIWTFETPALSDGLHELSATVSNAVGSTSPASDTFSINVDTQAPAIPVLSAIMDDVGKIKGMVTRNGKTDDTTPTLTGTAEGGVTVEVYDYSTQITALKADDAGQWAYTTDTLDNGSIHVYTAVAVDTVGNASAASKAYSITINTGEKDTTPPFAPTIDSITDDAGDTEIVVANKGKSNDNTLTLNGTAEANSTVEVFNGVTSLGTVKASKVGDWVFTTPALTDDTQRFTATATDAAKNTSDVSNTFVVTTDTTPPATPVIDRVNDDVGSIKGIVSNPGATDDQTLTLSGQAEALSTVELFDGKNTLTTLQADKSGNWTYTTQELSEGRHTFTAKATDGLGNISPGSAEYTVAVDTKAPTLSVSTDKTSLKAGETAAVSFTFSEIPTGFDATDITTSGGTLSALSGTGLTRTAIFTPTANTNTLAASLNVAANTYTDAAGNNGSASN
ncbi:MAG: Ig-like domain-containing protein, partial [Methylococcaceae bacterium]